MLFRFFFLNTVFYAFLHVVLLCVVHCRAKRYLKRNSQYDIHTIIIIILQRQQTNRSTGTNQQKFKHLKVISVRNTVGRYFYFYFFVYKMNEGKSARVRARNVFEWRQFCNKLLLLPLVPTPPLSLLPLLAYTNVVGTFIIIFLNNTFSSLVVQYNNNDDDDGVQNYSLGKSLHWVWNSMINKLQIHI